MNWAPLSPLITSPITLLLAQLALATLETLLLWMYQAYCCLRAFSLVPSAWTAFPWCVLFFPSFIQVSAHMWPSWAQSMKQPYCFPLVSLSPFSLAFPNIVHICLKRAGTLFILFSATSSVPWNVPAITVEAQWILLEWINTRRRGLRRKKVSSE